MKELSKLAAKDVRCAYPILQDPDDKNIPSIHIQDSAEIQESFSHGTFLPCVPTTCPLRVEVDVLSWPAFGILFGQRVSSPDQARESLRSRAKKTTHSAGRAPLRKGVHGLF